MDIDAPEWNHPLNKAQTNHLKARIRGGHRVLLEEVTELMMAATATENDEVRDALIECIGSLQRIDNVLQGHPKKEDSYA